MVSSRKILQLSEVSGTSTVSRTRLALLSCLVTFSHELVQGRAELLIAWLQIRQPCTARWCNGATCKPGDHKEINAGTKISCLAMLLFSILYDGQKKTWAL